MVCIDFHTRCNTALIVLNHLKHQLGNNIVRLCNKELEVLLKWKGVAMSKMGNTAKKQAHNKLGNLARCTEVNEEALIALPDAPIEIGDTAYGQYKAQKKRDVKTAYQKMFAEERESLKLELAEIDEAATGDGQSPPTNITPVHIDNIY